MQYLIKSSTLIYSLDIVSFFFKLGNPCEVNKAYGLNSTHCELNDSEAYGAVNDDDVAYDYIMTSFSHTSAGTPSLTGSTIELNSNESYAVKQVLVHFIIKRC